jgi:uncharacterized protein YndB with AHSA1/START domain
MKVVPVALALFGFSLVPAAAAFASERALRAEILVPAPLAEVWSAWTTDAGIATFFAPEGHVDLRVDGTYDVWFFPEAEAGKRGAEGMRILVHEPMRRFSFTWDAPPSIPTIRNQRTVVVLEFAPHGERATRLRFTHSGWGEGEDWDRAYEYFRSAWGTKVLPRLVHRFTAGPLDWNAIPAPPPVEMSAVRLVAKPESTGAGMGLSGRGTRGVE